MTTSTTQSTSSCRRNRFHLQDSSVKVVLSRDDMMMFAPQVVTGEPQNIVFTIPIFEPLPSQYYIKVVSDRWLGAEAICAINFQNLILPERHPPHTGESWRTRP